MVDRCNRCRFWQEEDGTRDPEDVDFAFGKCRRKAPKIIGALAACMVERPAWGTQYTGDGYIVDTTDLSRVSLQPVTFATDWCGQFEDRESEIPL